MALAVITLQPQAGAAITLWLNCILTIIRHGCEQMLPGRELALRQDHKLPNREHPASSQGAVLSRSPVSGPAKPRHPLLAASLDIYPVGNGDQTLLPPGVTQVWDAP